MSLSTSADTAFLNQIIDQLCSRKQAATYGALAGLVGSTPQAVMSDLPRSAKYSWVVNARTQRPIGDAPAEWDPDLPLAIEQRGIIRTPEALEDWLQQKASGPAFFFDVDHPSLHRDEQGVIRVGKTRISLDLIVEQYESGMSAEDIVQAYDQLQLADVHEAISFYLRHRRELAVYLQNRSEEAIALQIAIKSEFPHLSRKELSSRQAAKEDADVKAGQ